MKFFLFQIFYYPIINGTNDGTSLRRGYVSTDTCAQIFMYLPYC